jgi:hypothetical protein
MKTNKSNFSNNKTGSFSLKQTSKLLSILFMSLTLVVSCSDDDNPEEVNELELFTDVTLTFENINDANDTVVLTSIAPEGQDGPSTETVVGDFTEGATYSLSLELLDASETPAEDKLEEDVIPEADEHFFVFAVSSGLNLTVSRDSDDIDGPDGQKLGVKTTWVAGNAGTGNFNFRLVHEPVGADASNGFGSVTSGEDDININFLNVEIVQ